MTTWGSNRPSHVDLVLPQANDTLEFHFAFSCLRTLVLQLSVKKSRLSTKLAVDLQRIIQIEISTLQFLMQVLNSFDEKIVVCNQNLFDFFERFDLAY